MARERGPFEGWPIVGWAVAAAAIAVGACFALRAGDDAFATAIRVTAKMAFVLFAASFAASSLVALRPSRATKWMLRNRRQLGVSFALVHFGHLSIILARGRPLPMVAVIGGGLAYLFVAAMVATSFDRTAALVGRRAWKVLHGIGAWYLFVLFALAYLSRVTRPEEWPFSATAVALIALRVGAPLRRRARARVARAG